MYSHTVRRNLFISVTWKMKFFLHKLFSTKYYEEEKKEETRGKKIHGRNEKEILKIS
jgi:hypothetical protein